MHKRLAKASETGGLGSKVELLRTHPLPERRIKVGQIAYCFKICDESVAPQHLEELVPEAYEIRASNLRCAGVRDSIQQFLGGISRWG